jgi:hypothetical protein
MKTKNDYLAQMQTKARDGNPGVGFIALAERL